jgi:hypothetical protein
MRQLGRGHSVMFFAPMECDKLIRAAAPVALEDDATVKALDILRWVMHETCDDIRHYVPHWVQQGLEYERRSVADRAFKATKTVQTLKHAWLTPEARGLEELYGKQGGGSNLMRDARAIPAMQERLEELGVSELDDPRIDEEQEREVSHEMEQERQVERPAVATPATPELHPDVVHFATSGRIKIGSTQFKSLFLPLETAEGSSVWSSFLLATADFMRTIQGTSGTSLSAYLRPLNWILSSTIFSRTILVAVSPFEANELLPTIRESKAVHLHIYAPRTIQSMRSFADLRFFTIPPLPASGWTGPSLGLRSQLNLWAGQLYIDEYKAYTELCAFLGVFSSDSERLYKRSEIPRRADGFIEPKHRRVTLALGEALKDFDGCSFQNSPIAQLKELVSLRRNGMSFLKTHVGQLLHGRQLRPEDF